MATFSSIETAVTKITSWITLSLLSYFSGTVHSLIKLFCLIKLVVVNLSLGVFMIWQTWFLALHVGCLVLVLSHSVEVGNIIIFIFQIRKLSHPELVIFGQSHNSQWMWSWLSDPGIVASVLSNTKIDSHQ